MPPKVSVITSVYNGQRYLPRAVESILTQTLPDFEFIIIDDDSTDNSKDIIEEYAKQDHRIKLVENEENIGLTKSLNKGLLLAQGEYIARQDADDLSLPQRLQKQAGFLDRHPEILLVSSDYEVIDAQGNLIELRQRSAEPDLIAWYMLFQNYIGGHSVVMFRREPVVALGGYAEIYHYAQDYELWLRLLRVGDIAVLPDVLLQWRIHKQSVSVKLSSEQAVSALQASKRNLKMLTGIEFTLPQLIALRDFWQGLPLKSKQVGLLHADLKAIYQKFLVFRKQQGYVDPTLSGRLRSIICRQLLYCARTTDWTQTVGLKLKVLPYAFNWHTGTVFDYWLKAIWKLYLWQTNRSNR